MSQPSNARTFPLERHATRAGGPHVLLLAHAHSGEERKIMDFESCATPRRVAR